MIMLSIRSDYKALHLSKGDIIEFSLAPYRDYDNIFHLINESMLPIFIHLSTPQHSVYTIHPSFMKKKSSYCPFRLIKFLMFMTR